MLLNGDEIKRRGLVLDADPHMFKAASYNPRIGKILTSDGEIRDHYALPPLGTAEVISMEVFKLTKDVAGYATVKTSLCNDGVLAINIGLLDPLWTGPVSSTLINFGKNSYYLKSGNEFLRITFHQYDAQEEVPPPSAQLFSPEQYQYDRQRKVLEHLSDTFMNLDNMIKKMWQDIWTKFWHQSLIWVPLLAFVLTVSMVLVTSMNAINRSIDQRVEGLCQKYIEMHGLAQQLTENKKQPKDTQVAQHPRNGKIEQHSEKLKKDKDMQAAQPPSETKAIP